MVLDSSNSLSFNFFAVVMTVGEFRPDFGKDWYKYFVKVLFSFDNLVLCYFRAER